MLKQEEMCFWLADLEETIKNELEREAYLSYPADHPYRKNCSKCGRTLKYKSISYNEGFHIDSCE